jgi:peptidoglycan/LPS O-acetylase OafA/YrhL
MRDQQPSKTRDQAVHRYESLDCLRGIAASLVLIGHALVLMTGPSALVKLVDGKLRIDTMLGNL